MMNNEMDMPQAHDPKDRRYTNAIMRIQTVIKGREVAEALIACGGLAEAKMVCQDCYQLTLEAENILIEIGDIQGAMRAGQLATIISGCIDNIDEHMDYTL